MWLTFNQTLDTLHTSFPRALVPYLPDLLSASLEHLRVLYPIFSTYCLSASESAPSTSEDETLELPQLLCPIIDLLAAVVRGGRARDWVVYENILPLVSSIFAFVQMTDEDVKVPILNSFHQSSLAF